MKTTARSQTRSSSARAAKILRALRDARKDAVKSARMHGVPVVYLRDGRIVRERP
jgi:hypothetical protein